MVQKVFKKALVLAVFAVINCPHPLIAQGPNFDPSQIEFASEEDRQQFAKMPASIKQVLMGLAPAPTMSPEEKKQSIQNDFLSMSRQYSWVKGSPEWKYHEDRILRQKPFEKPKQPGHEKPIEQYRFNGGSPLPGINEINNEFQRKLSKAKESAARKPRKKKRPLRLSQNSISEIRQQTVITKPKCRVSNSATLAIPEEFLAAGQPIDTLFFNGVPPFDIATAIGRSTQLIIFGDKSEAENASMYANLPISCLPFRIRSTGKRVTYAQGADALKNFDANPESNGTLDPTVKKYLEQEEMTE